MKKKLVGKSTARLKLTKLRALVCYPFKAQEITQGFDELKKPYNYLLISVCLFVVPYSSDA